ncbi:MAG: AI-2E family transporter, partial [Omnitrophica WOR_2 bacterium]
MANDSPSQFYHWTFQRVVWATLIFVVVALSFWLFYRFSQVFFILFIAIVIGTVIRPVVNWLYSRGFPRMAGSILVYLLLLALLIGFVLLLFPLIAEQSGKIAALVPGYYQSLRGWMTGNPNPLIEQLSEFLPANLALPGPA